MRFHVESLPVLVYKGWPDDYKTNRTCHLQVLANLERTDTNIDPAAINHITVRIMDPQPLIDAYAKVANDEKAANLRKQQELNIKTGPPM